MLHCINEPREVHHHQHASCERGILLLVSGERIFLIAPFCLFGSAANNVAITDTEQVVCWRLWLAGWFACG